MDEDIKKRLMNDGMDELLATHFAHLFIRDPLVIFSEDLEELYRNVMLLEKIGSSGGGKELVAHTG